MGGALGADFSPAPQGTARGDVRPRFGNWTACAEFNIYLDPESASAVFADPVLASKTTLVPLDLTHQFLATADVQRRIRGGGQEGGGPDSSSSLVRRLFYEILTFFAKTYADVFGEWAI
jgi:uridine nucleosidase